jgi:hypothetical protein
VTGGLHGANRCEGNALPETQTFGAIAGREAAGYAETARVSRPSDDLVKEAMKTPLALMQKKSGIQHFEIRKKVQDMMWKQVGVVRTSEGLENAVREFDRMEQEDVPQLLVKYRGQRYNRELFEALETLNMVEVGEVMARSAALRKESRGAHFLRDLPERDDKNWLVNRWRNGRWVSWSFDMTLSSSQGCVRKEEERNGWIWNSQDLPIRSGKGQKAPFSDLQRRSLCGDAGDGCPQLHLPKPRPESRLPVFLPGRALWRLPLRGQWQSLPLLSSHR